MHDASLDEKLRDIETEIARQDRVFQELKACLASFGDVEIQLPMAFFEDIETAARSRGVFVEPSALGIRG